MRQTNMKYLTRVTKGINIYTLYFLIMSFLALNDSIEFKALKNAIKANITVKCLIMLFKNRYLNLDSVARLNRNRKKILLIAVRKIGLANLIMLFRS